MAHSAGGLYEAVSGPQGVDGSEEFVQQAVKRKASLVRHDTIFTKERRDPVRPEIALDAACCKCQVLKAIADSESAAVEKARELTCVSHEVRQTGIPVGYHEIMRALGP